MSPSSSPRRRAPAALLGLLLAVLNAAAAHAQPSDQQAALLSGPHPVRDLLMFPPNALSAQEADYGFRQARVTVLYTRERLVLPVAWTPRFCGSLRLLEVTGHEPSSLCYTDEQGALFFSFPATDEAPALAESLRCPFIDAFVRRFRVLRGFVNEELEAPFPGVLEVTAR